MGKLFNLKEWLSVRDTARHLSHLFKETVTDADVLRFSLDERLLLSMFFFDPVEAQPKTRAEDWKHRLLAGESGLTKLEDRVENIEGLWDLPMIGNGRRYVEQLCQTAKHGFDAPSIRPVNHDSVFVEGTDKSFYRLENGITAIQKCGQLVVRTEELQNFERRVSRNNGSNNKTEHESLLKIILGMAMAAYNYEPGQKRNAATGDNNGSIAADLVRQGLSMNSDTIRKYLKEAEAHYPEAGRKPDKT